MKNWFELKLLVKTEHTAQAYGSGSLLVLATPCMIAFMERAALEAAQMRLQEGFTTVGTSVDVEHLAAVPVGETVTFRAVLQEEEGRKLVFSVEAVSTKEVIGRGTHVRFVVDAQKFMNKIQDKYVSNE